MIPKMAPVIAVLCLAFSVFAGSVLAEPQGDKKPTFTKRKFHVPLSADAVKAAWAALGFSTAHQVSYIQGWSRGEHTHAWDIFITMVSGKMEFIINGQRYVVDPGDELFYPANATISARNLHEGMSIMFNTGH